MNPQFELGDKVADPITGITGVVTTRCTYLHAVPRVLIEGKDSTGRAASDWVEEARLRPQSE